MSLKYTTMNRIRFTEISDRYDVNRVVKGKISELHAKLITYVVSHFRNSNQYKQKVVKALNIITYAVYANDPLPFNWSVKDPFSNMPDIEESLLQETLGDVYLTVDGIEWDVNVHYDSDIDVHVASKSTTQRSKKNEPTVPKVFPPTSNIFTSTSKQDLYIQAPIIPQIDYSKVWMTGVVDSETYTIYETLPRIPTKQNEVSCTTNPSQMTDKELLRLYPNVRIRTRATSMYEPVSGIRLHPILGLILPIKEYTEQQLVENLIQYPHFFKLMREIDGKQCSFYSHIEIDGKLVSILDIWDDLPESQIIPKQVDFIKEYVVRRYLLERDIDGIKHKYPMFGDLDPFLTLPLTIADYKDFGYTDAVKLARQCVASRVNYKVSRNPIVRRLECGD